MTKAFAVLSLSMIVGTSAFAAGGKKEAGKAEPTRQPASNTCVAGNIADLEGSAVRCNTGKWIATGDNFTATVCCVDESRGNGGGGNGGAPTAR